MFDTLPFLWISLIGFVLLIGMVICFIERNKTKRLEQELHRLRNLNRLQNLYNYGRS